MKTRTIILLCVASAVLAFLVALFGPRLLNRQPKMHFATIDLTGVIRKQQESNIRLLASPTADEGAKKTALAEASEFGKRANAEVLALSVECECVLLMREAVVAGQIEDMTPRLLVRLHVQ